MASDSCSQAHEAIQRFLAEARQPVVVEPGMDPIPLTAGAHEIRFDGQRLSLQAWSAGRNLYRRITAVEAEAAGRIDLVIQKFGGRPGPMQLLDQAHARTGKLTRKAARLSHRDVFRRFLSRQFSGWQIAELSADADLQHSFSSAYTRALIRRGTTGMAAIGVPDAADADGALTYGLIWLDYIRRRNPKLTVQGLIVLLPERSERTTCHRIRHLNPSAASFAVYVRTDGWEQQIDIADAGNVVTELVPHNSDCWTPEWLRPVQALDGVETIGSGAGVSLRVFGLEFARCEGGEVRFGIGTKRLAHDWHSAEIASLARELIRARHPENRSHPLYAMAPERWLESLIRRHITRIDAGLQAFPVYGQAPTFVAGERGVIDLLAAGTDGRLAVIEVKASEDPHLPLQALEYWARVHWHQQRGEFTQRGYFPRTPLTNEPPRMFLVAPALHFHPTTETILRFFPPDLEVVRIGVAAGWRSDLSVVFRAFGAETVSAGTLRRHPLP